MAVGDIMQMAMRGQYEGQLIVMVTHWRFDNATASIDHFGGIPVGTGMPQVWVNEWRTLHNAGFQYDEARLRMLIPFGAQKNIPISSNRAGTRAGTGIPSFCAPLVHWHTAAGGRRKRGRTFLPPVPVTDTSASNITAGMQALIQAQVDSWLARFSATGSSAEYTMGVWSRSNGGANPPFSAAGFQPITSGIATNLLAVQRRRRVGTGR